MNKVTRFIRFSKDMRPMLYGTTASSVLQNEDVTEQCAHLAKQDTLSKEDVQWLIQSLTALNCADAMLRCAYTKLYEEHVK